VDSVGAANLTGWPHANTPQEATDIVYGARKHVAFTPHGDGEFLALLSGVKAASIAGGRAVVVIDEVFRWSYPVPPDELTDAFQAHRHRLPGTPVLYTSQYVGFLQPHLLNCIDVAYVFYTQSFRALKRLNEEYGIDPDAVRSLHFPPPPLDYLTWEI
jgi:hypothetical protein